MTTFRIGGSARLFARVSSVDDLYHALACAHERGVPVHILGGGSNTLFDDAGFDGLVLKMEMRGVSFEERADGAVLCVAHAGEEWDALVARAAQEGLWGIENLSGIPGSVGGAVVQNIGAYGAELCESVEWVEAYDCEGAQKIRLSSAECGFGYRSSIFKERMGCFIVLRAAFRLSRTPAPRLSYRDLAAAYAEDSPAAPGAVRDTVMAIRALKFPDLSTEGTAGSFFLNPALSLEEAARLECVVPGLPLFPQHDGRVKIALAYLLDRGLGLRGHAYGTARLFERQPLVMVVRFGASSRDVRALMEDVQERVCDAYGIRIEPEVCIV